VVIVAGGGDPVQDLSNLYGCKSFPPAGQNRPAEMNRIQEQIVHDAPTIVLDTRKDISAYNDDLKNWKPNSTGPFDDMMNVDI
jgi:ABC-type transport system substrate-binding protein